ncbi:hypothetical protein VTO42DRAFT_7291 [Malbranchea cinnamomea]
MASNPTLRRLMKEAHELSAASSFPSPYFHAHPVSDSDFFHWHFTLAGPPAPSPYAGGIYHGRIVFPPTYPLRPPSFRFLTPSGRFEVNREICLSISGHHEETWQPAWGIRTALIALRSYMAVDAAGQVGGIDAREEVRREWARRSRGWKCEVCSGGKTNEEVLAEWREVCRSKGVDVDEEDEISGRKLQDSPVVLRFGYKDEQGRVTDLKNENVQPLTASADSTSVSNTSTSPTAPTRSSPSQKTYIRGRDTPNASCPSVISQSPSSSRQGSSRPAQQPNSQLATRSTARASADSTAWMDKAIPILGIALIIMIIKSWIFPLIL